MQCVARRRRVPVSRSRKAIVSVGFPEERNALQKRHHSVDLGCAGHPVERHRAPLSSRLNLELREGEIATHSTHGGLTCVDRRDGARCQSLSHSRAVPQFRIPEMVLGSNPSHQLARSRICVSPSALNFIVQVLERLYKLAGLTENASHFLPFPLLSSMSSPVPEPSSSQRPPDFRLAGSENLRKPRWKLENLPDLTGKVVMVTNPNNRVGKNTAKVPIMCSTRTSHR